VGAIVVAKGGVAAIASSITISGVANALINTTVGLAGVYGFANWAFED
jgi:hypothetical protein